MKESARAREGGRGDDAKLLTLGSRSFFRPLNWFLVAFWKLGVGAMLNAFPPLFGRVAVLVIPGRKSGRLYHVPVNYSPTEDGIFCLSGYRGSQWYRNLLAASTVEVWLSRRVEVGQASAVEWPEQVSLVVEKVWADSGWLARALSGFCVPSECQAAHIRLAGSPQTS